MTNACFDYVTQEEYLNSNFRERFMDIDDIDMFFWSTMLRDYPDDLDKIIEANHVYQSSRVKTPETELLAAKELQDLLERLFIQHHDMLIQG